MDLTPSAQANNSLELSVLTGLGTPLWESCFDASNSI